MTRRSCRWRSCSNPDARLLWPDVLARALVARAGDEELGEPVLALTAAAGLSERLGAAPWAPLTPG